MTRRRWRSYTIGLLVMIPLVTVAAVLAARLSGHSRESHNINGSVTANCSVVAGGSILADTINVSCGPQISEINDILRQLTSDQGLFSAIEELRSRKSVDSSLLKNLAENLGLSVDQILAIMKSLAKESLPSDQIIDKFAQLAELSNVINVETARVKGTTSDVNALREQISDALRDGEITHAGFLLSAAIAMGDPTPRGSAYISLDNTPHNDWGSPALIELNKLYMVGNGYAAVRFLVPKNVRRVELQYKSGYNVPCSIDISYWDNRIEYWRVGEDSPEGWKDFPTSEVFYSFGVGEGDLDTIHTHSSPGHWPPHDYMIQIASKQQQSAFIFAIVVE
jgi:hypothetical protein